MPWRLIRQLGSYGLVGGCAALVEWITFFVLIEGVGAHYLAATTVAFLVATYVNWLVGRRLTFRHAGQRFGLTGEVSAIYLVSGVGWGLNMILMYLLVSVLAVGSMPAKILATGIVFLWNFAARKRLVYRT